jgi:hypothetical protein
MRSDRSFDELVENYDRREAIRSDRGCSASCQPREKLHSISPAKPGVTRF